MKRTVKAVVSAIRYVSRIGRERAEYHHSELHRRPPDRHARTAYHYRPTGGGFGANLGSGDFGGGGGI